MAKKSKSGALTVNFSSTLKPLKTPRAHRAFGVLDIEGRKWVNCLAVGTYNGTDYRAFHGGIGSAGTLENVKNFLEWAFSPENKVSLFFAHFAGIYDNLFLLQAALEEDYIILEFLTRGASLICLTLSNGERQIEFRDSGALLPYGLAKLTETYNVTHKKLDVDASHFQEVTHLMLNYLQHDCMGLYEVLEKYYSHPLIQRSGMRFTEASQALQVFRTFLKEPFPACPEWLDPFIRRAYAGGRVEIFKPLWESEKPLHCFDINSLFPACMAQEDLPGEFLRADQTLDLDKLGFCFCDVYVPDMYYPPLWVIDEIEGERFDIKQNKYIRHKTKKLVFPTGYLTGTWPIAELAYAATLGVKILKVRSTAYFASAGPVFKEYMETMYRLRSQETDAASREIYKKNANTVYGRMGIDPMRDTLEFEDGQTGVKPDFEIKAGEKWFRMVRGQKRIKTYSHVGVSAYTTAHARIRNHKTLLKLDPVYNTDTDSFFTPVWTEPGTGLGELKHEYSVHQACFLLPKTYRAGVKVRMKGFDSRKTSEVSFEQFKMALEGEFRIAIKNEGKMLRLRAALKKGSALQIGEDTVKSICSRYDKRKLVKRSGVWDSRPLHKTKEGAYL
jgi:hypothetical protein